MGTFFHVFFEFFVVLFLSFSVCTVVTLLTNERFGSTEESYYYDFFEKDSVENIIGVTNAFPSVRTNCHLYLMIPVII
jgi:hypothetical protein